MRSIWTTLVKKLEMVMERKIQGICPLPLDTTECKHQKSNDGKKIKAFARKSPTRVTNHPVRKLDNPYLKKCGFL